ncbi:hypothetical protein Avbf_12315 [Armadillidium vulgare]|nr:hypothetical protein Avbf_12315 [Armadillidium vulgare]
MSNLTRISCHETEVLLPSDKRISSLLPSSLLPSSSSSVTTAAPILLQESFSPSFAHSSDTLPLHDDEGGRLISGLRTSLDIKKGLTYWSSSQPDPDESLDVIDREFSSAGGVSPAAQERESIRPLNITQ